MTESASGVRLMLGDCLERLRELPDCSVDSVVTDPPYGLSFMGKKWDYDVPSVEVWEECLRVLKPGGHLLAFAGTRTQHRMAVRIEDAGFEIRDMIAWVYGSGFPKSLDVSKSIDRAAGVEREIVGEKITGRANAPRGDGRNHVDCAGGQMTVSVTAPTTEAAKQWDGWGTALKPALEPITVARKPLGEKTVAANMLEHGTGAINVDGCRVGRDSGDVSGWSQSGSKESENRSMSGGNYAREPKPDSSGRWPANLIHDGSEEVVRLFPQTTSGGDDKHGRKKSTFCASTYWEAFKGTSSGGDTGSSARFFYCSKASKKDRDEGLEGFRAKKAGSLNLRTDAHSEKNGMNTASRANHHPTVKPTDLMRYLCRLVTQPGGVVLDPFMGSGSTGKAAVLEGFQFIGIEREREYLDIATRRIADASPLSGMQNILDSFP